MTTPPLPPTPPGAVAHQGSSQQPDPTPFDLARYRDRHRVLLLFAPSTTDHALAAEDAALREQAAGVADRDLVVVRALESGPSTVEGRPLGVADAAALRRRLRVDAGRFTVLLVGKDGHVAMRSHEPIVAGRLFPTIDAMPMRRAEMRRRREG